MKPSLIILGLGNPGTAYAKTRHNLGFWGVDALSQVFGTGDWKEQQKFLALTQEARILTFPILLVKPLTYMNDSGEAAKKLVEFYKLQSSEQLLVIVDDIDLPLGELRFRKTGGPGTHNGLKSLVLQFGENFPRLRIGLGEKPAGADLATWVLSSPTKEETEVLRKAAQSLPDRVKSYVLEQGGSEESPAD